MYNVMLYIDFSLYSIGLLTAFLLYFKKEAPFYLKLFPPFLLLNIIVNFIAHRILIKGGSSHLIYNFYSLFSIVFYFVILYYIIRSRRIKKVILHAAWVYPILALGNIFFIQGVAGFHTYSYGLGAALVVFFCVYYFQERLLRDQSTLKLTRDPSFWICAGVLFFFSITFIGFSSIHVIMHYPAGFLRILSLVIKIAEYLLYLSLIMAFICALKIPKMTTA